MAKNPPTINDLARDAANASEEEKKLRKNVLAAALLPILDRIAQRKISHIQEADRENLIQETIMKILINISNYDTKKDFLPWVTVILLRTHIDIERRENKTRSGGGNTLIGTHTEDGGNSADLLLGRELNPAEVAENEDLTTFVLTQLPPRTGEIIRMRLGGLSDRDIAKNLGITVSAVSWNRRLAATEIPDILKTMEARESASEHPRL